MSPGHNCLVTWPSKAQMVSSAMYMYYCGVIVINCVTIFFPFVIPRQIYDYSFWKKKSDHQINVLKVLVALFIATWVYRTFWITVVDILSPLWFQWSQTFWEIKDRPFRWMTFYWMNSFCLFNRTGQGKMRRDSDNLCHIYICICIIIFITVFLNNALYVLLCKCCYSFQLVFNHDR